MSLEQVLYTAHGSASGGREGFGHSSDKLLDVTLTIPTELGGNGATGTNPEQLFAVGYAACFLSAMKFVAGRENFALPDETRIDSSVGIGAQGSTFGLEVALKVTVPGMAHAQAEALVEKAHQVCPYSKATRGNIDVKLSVA
jgi:Ohr subfamily peroxiredoxin